MNDGPVNEGVQLSGGSVTIGAMAVGRMAQLRDVTTQVTSGGAAPGTDPTNPAGGSDSADPTGAASVGTDLQALLVVLGEQVEVQRAHLPDPDQALRLVAELRGVLDQPQPVPERVRSLLTRLVDALHPVGELAILTKAVGEAVRSVLGLR